MFRQIKSATFSLSYVNLLPCWEKGSKKPNRAPDMRYPLSQSFTSISHHILKNICEPHKIRDAFQKVEETINICKHARQKVAENTEALPEEEYMVMSMADKEVRHHIINTHFPNRFTYRATILRIKCVGLHALDITFFTDSLSFQVKILQS